jgi:hypothetical protein
MPYTWKVMLTGARAQEGQESTQLEEDLNQLEDQGYEIYTILPMEKEGLMFAIVARKSAERARRDALRRANRRARQRTMRSVPRR